MRTKNKKFSSLAAIISVLFVIGFMQILYDAIYDRNELIGIIFIFIFAASCIGLFLFSYNLLKDFIDKYVK